MLTCWSEGIIKEDWRYGHYQETKLSTFLSALMGRESGFLTIVYESHKRDIHKNLTHFTSDGEVLGWLFSLLHYFSRNFFIGMVIIQISKCIALL